MDDVDLATRAASNNPAQGLAAVRALRVLADRLEDVQVRNARTGLAPPQGPVHQLQLSHIPWAIPLLVYVPGASENLNKMQVAGEKAVEDRINLGSTHPDLFHYLVSHTDRSS